MEHTSNTELGQVESFDISSKGGQGFDLDVESVFDNSSIFTQNIYSATIKPLSENSEMSQIAILESEKSYLELLARADIDKHKRQLVILSKSDKAYHDQSLLSYNYDSYDLPEIIMPEETSFELAIREKGELIVSTLAEAVGIIDDVIIPRSFNKAGAKEKQIRNIKWEEVSKYQLNTQVAKKKHPTSYIHALISLMMKPIDGEGVLLNVPLKPLANEIGVSLRTLKAQLLNMEQNGHIELLEGSLKEPGVRYSHFSYKICKHAERDRTPGGYISLSKYAYLQFLEIKDVNVLRLAIRAYMRIARDVAVAAEKGNKKITVSFTMRELQSFLPTYVGNKPAVQKMMDTLNESGLFEFQFGYIRDQLVMFMNMNLKMFHKVYENTVTNAVKQMVIHLLHENTINITKKDIKDLLQMTFQYGLRKMIETVNVIKGDFFMIDSINKGLYELGAFARIITERNATQFRF